MRWHRFADHNERPYTINSSFSFPFKLVDTISLDRNYVRGNKLIVCFVTFKLHLNMLETEKTVAIWDKNGMSFQSKRLTWITSNWIRVFYAFARTRNNANKISKFGRNHKLSALRYFLVILLCHCYRWYCYHHSVWTETSVIKNFRPKARITSCLSRSSGTNRTIIL